MPQVYIQISLQKVHLWNKKLLGLLASLLGARTLLGTSKRHWFRSILSVAEEDAAEASARLAHSRVPRVGALDTNAPFGCAASKTYVVVGLQKASQAILHQKNQVHASLQNNQPGFCEEIFASI